MTDAYKEMEQEASIDEDEEDDKRLSHRTINCMSKEPDCHKLDCIKQIECGGEGSPGHCYAIITPDYSTEASKAVNGEDTADSQFSIADFRSNVSHSHIVQAGCTVGGMECESFATIRAYVEEKFADVPNVLKDINTRYQPPAVLLDPKVSGKCVAYAENQNRINGQLFCCCASENCNQQIYLIQETNPYIKLMSELNTVERKPKPTSSTIKLPNQNNNTALLTTGQLYLLAISALALLVFVLIGILFIMRRNSRRKPQQQQSQPNVYYSRSNSSDLLNNHQNANNLAHNGPGHPSHHEFNRLMSNSSATNNGASNRNQLFTNEEYMSLTQPLLMHQNATFASSMVAPNITVLPSNLFNNTNHVGRGSGPAGPTSALTNGNMMNGANLSNQHFTIDYSNQVNNVVLNDHMMPITRLRSLDNDEELFEPLPEQLPRNLKASDLYLLEKIAHGQFSSVWKARCKTEAKSNEEKAVESDEPTPEYAVKIFANNQKSAWSNEKEIYNTLASTNPNILRYYASDIFELPVAENSDVVSTTSSLNYEYWIMTEYHPVGSLYDFLKLQHLSWPQMVRLLVCILDGLAYLHSENLEIKKNYAIAHRDLKSKNILVKSDGQSCCIGDFGLALKVTNNIYKLQSAEIRSKVGTRRYMSPELIEGAIAFTKETFLRIDVYACSLVMWEILSRGDFFENPCEYRLPFEEEVGQNPSLEDMKDIVVEKNMRPIIKPEWLKHHQVGFIAQTIEECWDIDLDARISSELASSRVRKIYQTI